MSKRRVVITGMGTINSVGHNVKETWKNLLAGESGIDQIKNFEITDEYASKIAGEIKNYDPNEYFDRKRIKKSITIHNMLLSLQNKLLRIQVLTLQS